MRIDTVRHVINAFRHYAEDRSGRTNDDLSMPNLLVYYYLNMYRQTESAKLARNLGAIGMGAGTVHTIPCMELEKLDVIDSPFVPPTGCYFLKSKYPLPVMMDGLPITVTTVAPDCKNCDGEIREFTYVEWQNFQYKVNSRIHGQSGELYYTVKNEGNISHLYIYTNSRFDMLKAAAISLIPKNPLDIISYPKCGEGVKVPCSYLDDQFIIDPEIEAAVFENALRSLLTIKGSSPPADIFNNANLDSANPNAPKT